MALSWSARRQTLYYAVGAAIVLVLGVGIWQIFFAKPAICFDGAKNGDERGIDCGGSCALLCPADVKNPTVLWARAFQVAPGAYSAVAYVENKNIGAGARGVKYSFRLFDDRNILVVERVGITSIPPALLVPIIDTNIDVGNRTVARAQFAFSDDEIQWVKNTNEIPVLRTTEQNLSQDGSRLSAKVVNDSVVDVRNLTVVAVLFDGAGVARAASKSTISRLARRSSQDVIFTWGGGVPNIVRAEITLLPAF